MKVKLSLDTFLRTLYKNVEWFVGGLHFGLVQKILKQELMDSPIKTTMCMHQILCI